MATEKHDEKSSPVPAILVLAGLLGVGGFIAFTNMTESAAESKLANESVDIERPAKDLELQQQGELVAPVAWADKTKGTATIPVDRAMDIVVKTLQANPAAATPAPPPPPPVDADAGADGEAADGGGDGAAADDDGAAASADAAAAAADGAAHAGDAAPPAPKPPPVAPKPPPVAPPAPQAP